MSRFILYLSVVVCLGCGTTGQNAQRGPLAAAKLELRTLESVDGHAVGIAATPGRFYLLSEEFLRYGSSADYREMLDDTNAIVRVMALACLAYKDRAAFAQARVSHFEDDGRVLLFPGGCVAQETTVGSIVRNIETNYYFLGWILKTRGGI